MNVFTSFGGWPNALCLPLPHLRFFLLAFVSLMTRFSCGSGLTQKGFLSRDSQHLFARRFHRQHRLQQIALMASVANRTQPARFGMVLIIHFRHVLYQQHPLLLLHHRLGLLQVRTHELFIAGLRTLQEAVRRFGGALASQLLGQRRHRISCQCIGDLHRSLPPSLIP